MPILLFFEGLCSHAETEPARAAYGSRLRRIQQAGTGLVFAALSLLPGPAMAATMKLVAFGDSLTAGYMLPADAAFPVKLEKALRADGFDVAITNAGVSGDTTSGGLDRIDWSIPDGTDGVILELGANDMLRGQDPALTRANLDAMLKRLKDRHIRVFLAGMRASPTLGTDYVQTFEAIYPDLAKAYDVPLYPFFLAGVAGQANLQLKDGMHPDAAGVDVIVKGILPSIEAWLKRFAPAG
jgi:acyl-CoA thioesterase-1